MNDVAEPTTVRVCGSDERTGGVASAVAHVPRRDWSATYLRVLTWVFTCFNSIRLLGYLPTVFAIIESGNSSQHSIFTWITWFGANGSMALWLYEQNGRQWSRAALVNIGNTTMCAITISVIVWYRVG